MIFSISLENRSSKISHLFIEKMFIIQYIEKLLFSLKLISFFEIYLKGDYALLKKMINKLFSLDNYRNVFSVLQMDMKWLDIIAKNYTSLEAKIH